MSTDKFQLMLTTAPDAATAEDLARQLVEVKLAACVTITAPATSVYQWQGETEQENEHLLLIKSLTSNFKAIDTFLQQQHPYEVPELISCNIEQVSASYGQWLTEALDSNDE